jgi:mono/diheme cytochrome c family protein
VRVLPPSAFEDWLRRRAQEGTGTGGGAAGGTEERGAAIFASAGCGGCHTLADAGTSGNVGPNLDEAQPDAELVVDRVTNGAGAMPPFASLEQRRRRRRVPPPPGGAVQPRVAADESARIRQHA